MLDRKYFILFLGLMAVLITLGNYCTQDYKMPELHTPLNLRNRTQRVSLRNGSEITTTATTKVSHNISSSSNDVTVVNLENFIQSKDVLYAVVFGYPRTGSSFTGELFNQNPDAFYIYEPFLDQRKMDHSRPLDNLMCNGYVKHTWKCFFVCNFTCLFKLIKIDHMHMAKSNIFTGYKQQCLQTRYHKKCIENLEIICKKRSIRVFKTVHSTMECAMEILSQRVIDPEKFRLIHLTRDPRASYQSRLVVNAVKKSKIKPYNQNVCARMHKDITIRNQLLQLYPKSFFDLHYEDLAHDPIYVAKSVYQFINQTDTPETVQKWLTYSTSASGEIEKRWDTIRRNSSTTADAWKSKMPDPMKKQIDSVCLDFYAISEYYIPVD